MWSSIGKSPSIGKFLEIHVTACVVAFLTFPTFSGKRLQSKSATQHFWSCSLTFNILLTYALLVAIVTQPIPFIMVGSQKVKCAIPKRLHAYVLVYTPVLFEMKYSTLALRCDLNDFFCFMCATDLLTGLEGVEEEGLLPRSQGWVPWIEEVSLLYR